MNKNVPGEDILNHVAALGPGGSNPVKHQLKVQSI